MERKRDPKGIPTGGEFATGSKSESDVELSARPPLVEKRQRGEFDVFNASMQEFATDDPRISRHLISFGGVPERKARGGLIGTRIEADEQGVNGLHPDEVAYALSVQKTKATVLYQSNDGSVHIKEGTLVSDPSGPAIIHKGSTGGKGILLRNQKVLAVRKGYGKAPELADVYHSASESFPDVEEATFDDIPEVKGYDEPPSEVAAVYAFHSPVFDSSQDGRGAMFFATDIQRGDGIVNGYAVYPPGSGLISEHGSLYVDDLKRQGGRVAGYRPGALTFSDAMKLGGQASSYSAEGDMRPTWDAVADASR